MVKDGSSSYRWFINALGVGRAPFLTLSIVTVGFAWALAVFQSGLPSFLDTLLILLAVISSHIGVNALNEYQDFMSGLDRNTVRTPFSGGSGTLVDAPEFLESTRWIAFGSIGLSVTIGLWFVVSVGIELLPVGILGLWIVVNYTSKLNQHPWLCLLSPGVGIGLLATLGSVYILSGQLSLVAVVLALGFSLLLNNLLLLNQYPDIDADRKFNRNHLWIAYGVIFSLAVFRAQWLVAHLLICMLMGLGLLPWYSVVALTGLILVYPMIKQTSSEVGLSENVISCLGKNVILCHFYPMTLSFILVISYLVA